MAALNPASSPSMSPFHTHATHHRGQITAPGQSTPELAWVHHLPPKTAEAQPI